MASASNEVKGTETLPQKEENTSPGQPRMADDTTDAEKANTTDDLPDTMADTTPTRGCERRREEATRRPASPSSGRRISRKRRRSARLLAEFEENTNPGQPRMADDTTDDETDDTTDDLPEESTNPGQPRMADDTTDAEKADTTDDLPEENTNPGKPRMADETTDAEKANTTDDLPDRDTLTFWECDDEWRERLDDAGLLTGWPRNRRINLLEIRIKFSSEYEYNSRQVRGCRQM